jgi:hypothetical protein
MRICRLAESPSLFHHRSPNTESGQPNDAIAASAIDFVRGTRI